MSFGGFPEEALDFYEGLEADNSRTYWQRHKDGYEHGVRAPMQALLDALEPEFGPGRIFRPNRDVRFSADKSPYKTHCGAVLSRQRGQAGGYVEISAAGLLVAGGYYSTESDQVERYRRAVDQDVPGRRLERIVARLRADGYQIAGQQLKTAPRGYPRDHPRADLLRHRSLYAHRSWKPEPWLHTAAVLDAVRDGWRAFTPLNDWLADQVGPSERSREQNRD
jgi:uncharacterized protein (TIGR02453 family)